LTLVHKLLVDGHGNEVVVMKNVRTDYIDMITLPSSSTPDPSEIPHPILEDNGSYEGTHHIPLVRLFYRFEDGSPYTLDRYTDVHISCNANGYAVVSTYNNPGIDEKNWLERSIILVKLDSQAPPEVFYLAKTHNTRWDYWQETQATITNDGTSVVWVANFNLPPPPDPPIVYVLRLDLKASP
jgi:hypothetical protein